MKNPNANVVRAIRTKKANVPADLQLSCKWEQKQISFGYAERSRQSIELICRKWISEPKVSAANFNVPADLQSAGNEYQDLFNPITSYLASSYTFNAKLSLDFSLLTS